MIVLAKIGIGLLGTVLVGGAMICSEGFVGVKVREKKVGGARVSFIVPAAIVPIALKFVPSRHLENTAGQLHSLMPAIDAAIPALEECPDGVLVEVIDAKDHVVITKTGSSIIVDVNDPDEVVRVAVPLEAVRSSLHEIARAGGPI